MNCYSRTALGSGAFMPPGEVSGYPASEMTGALVWSEIIPEVPRPSAMRALLRLSGAVHPQDSALAHVTDAELALVRETLDLLYRTGFTRAA